jgi:hypothetical protein
MKKDVFTIKIKNRSIPSGTVLTDSDFEITKINIDLSEYKYDDSHSYNKSAGFKVDDKYLFDKSKLKDVKTYYFVPGTKFDREYFKRLYPDLKYTRLIDKVDIVIYDNAAVYNGTLHKINPRDRWGQYKVEFPDKVIYLKDYETQFTMHYAKSCNLTLLDGKKLPELRSVSYYGEYVKKLIDDKYLGKMVHIDNLFAEMASDLLADNLDKESCLNILSQVLSNNIGTKKAAVETILNYKGYNLCKSIVLSFVSKGHTLKSTKLDIHNRSGARSYYVNHYRDPFWNFAESVCKDIAVSPDGPDKELALALINSQILQSYFIKSDVPFKLEFFLSADNLGPNKKADISEFVL